MAPIDRACPGVVLNDIVDRVALGSRVFGNAEALAQLEAIVHPLVRGDIRAFLARWSRYGARTVVLDVPLLLESGLWSRCDFVAVVSAPFLIQRQRVLARPGMTIDRLRQVLARQMPDRQKRRRADFIIPSGLGLAETGTAIDRLLDRAAKAPAGHWPPNVYRERCDARNRAGH